MFTKSVNTTAKYFLLLIILTMVCVNLSACKQQPKIDDKKLERIEYPALLDMLKESDPKKKTILVDVRSRERYEKGHIPGAISIPIQDLVWEDPRLMRVKHIVVYAGGWTDYLSPAAAKKLLLLGYESVYDFRGGVETWQAYGDRLEGAK